MVARVCIHGTRGSEGERPWRTMTMPTVDCPVCKCCQVDTERAEHKARHGSATYYFCGDECMAKFLEDPHKYSPPHSR